MSAQCSIMAGARHQSDPLLPALIIVVVYFFLGVSQLAEQYRKVPDILGFHFVQFSSKHIFVSCFRPETKVNLRARGAGT